MDRTSDEYFGVKKGAWTEEEDTPLRKCIEEYGEGKWSRVPLRAGLKRCRKSCRLRWLNYLRPNIKRGVFDEDEVDLIIRLQKLLGNRFSAGWPYIEPVLADFFSWILDRQAFIHLSKNFNQLTSTHSSHLPYHIAQIRDQ